MAKSAQLPDGRVVQFPDDATTEEITSAVNQIAQQESGAQAQGSDLSVGDYLVGAGETLMTLGTGALAEPYSGVAGLLGGGAAAAQGRGSLEDTAGFIEEQQKNLTYSPRTEAGQKVLETVAAPFQWYQEQVGRVGEAAADVTGSPAVGAGVQTAGEGGPALLGLRGTRGAMRARKSDVAEVEDVARQEGINLKDRGEPQAEQIAAAGERRAQGQESVGEGLPETQRAVQQARERAAQERTAAYDRARGARAGIRTEAAREFPDRAQRALSGFDTADMPKVRRRLSELDSLNELPEGSSVRLQAIEDWRKRINKNRSTDPSEAEALRTLKQEADDFVQEQFNQDMITGDPTAIAKWQEARGAHQRLKETFDTDKTIKSLVREEASPEQIKQWIIGASSTGAKKQAGSVINRIKRIVGEDSDAFQAVRNEVAFDLVEPLMRETPDLKAFSRQYDKFIRNNPTVAKSLFDEADQARMKRLSDFARANVKRGAPPPSKSLSELVGDYGLIFGVGHGLAQGSARLAAGRRLMTALRESRNKSKFLGEVLGYDPRAPLIPKTPIAAGGGSQALMEAEERGLLESEPKGPPAGMRR